MVAIRWMAGPGQRRWHAAALVLVLAALLATALGYLIRPRPVIALGDRDSALLVRQMHEREVAATGPGTALTWPAGAEALQVAGGHDGYLLITVTARDDQPADVYRLAMLAVNGERVAVGQRGPRQFSAIVPPGLARMAQLELRLAPALTGDVPPAGASIASLTIAPAYAYRWTRGQSALQLPGIGAGPWIVVADVIALHPDGGTVGGVITAAGRVLAPVPPTDAAGRRVWLLAPGAVLDDGDLTLEFGARVYRDPRPLGLVLERVALLPAATPYAPPPWRALLAGLLIAIGGCVALERTTRRPWLAVGATAALLLAGAWALGSARLTSAVMLPGLAGLALGSALLVLAGQALLPRLGRRLGLPLGRHLTDALLLAMVCSLWLKAGAMLYPHFVAIDVSWHMDRARWILDGQLPLLYGTGSPLNESTMPVAEWGRQPPVIPYSPWFHMLAASFSVLPWPLELSANLVSALLDVSRILLIALIARGAGLSGRQALFAALAYAVTPATFLLHSWGNLPTTYGMWWTLASTALVVLQWQALPRPRLVLALSLLLLLTFLIYTVMAVFMGVFLVLALAGLLLLGGDDGRQRARAIGLATLLAGGAALVIYYGQYLGPIWQRTIPYFLHAGDGEGVNAVARPPFGDYLAAYWPRLGYFRAGGHYGMQLILVIGLAGLLLVRPRWVRILLGAWLAVGALFLVAGSRMSMVDKHVFYVLPALALGAGALLGRLWRRGRAAPLVIGATAALTLLSAVIMWFFRVATVRQ
jgi:hypothetical protein